MYALIAANVAAFAVELASGASPVAPTSQQLIDLGGNFAPLTLHGQWWRLGASMFLHAGALHIGLNMLCLYNGRIVELLFGRAGLLAIYLVAGLGGGIASLVAGHADAVTVGASGAVFGVYGAFGAFLVMRRSQIEVEAWKRTARSMGTFVVLNLAIGLTATRISLSAHVGGIITGFAVGAALLAGARAAQQRIPRAVGLLVLGVGLSAAALYAVPAPAYVTPILRRFDAVEKAAINTWNEAVRRRKAGEITREQLATILERDVLPPYKAARQELIAPDDVSPRLHTLFQRINDYTAARIAAWEAFDAVERETDVARRKTLLARYQELDAEVTLRLEAFNTEIAHLKN